MYILGILHNGELAGYFGSARELRQGCSLSPYLFVICMNVLSKKIDKAASERKISYYPGCKDMELTHLCFADDLLVFVKGDKQSIVGTLEVFNSFATQSGLHISIEKSTVYMAGIEDDLRAEILREFPFEIGNLPVRYLGLPLLTRKMSKIDYTPLVEKIRSQIQSWSAKHLSFGGRLQLLRSVELNGKKAKVSWSIVCSPKQEGGLGIKPLEMVNKNGRRVSFWHDNWSQLGCLFDKLGQRGIIDLGIQGNSTLGTVLDRDRRRNHRNQLLSQIEEEIRRVRRERVVDMDDIPLWKGKSNTYKTKFNAKETGDQIRQSNSTWDPYPGIWFSGATPKYSFMAWLAVNNRLTTGSLMQRWKGDIDTSCSFCDETVESREHLFFACPYTKEIWEALVGNLMGANFTSNWLELITCITQPPYNAVVSFILRYIFQATVHTIWCERNRRRHGENRTPKELILKRLDITMRNRLSTLKRNGVRRFEDGLCIWFATRRNS
ncbi:uncharacterized protein LOC112082115 [Eutrema salsugineum]|uniref:uncharacterized protein LOC112082115 n=1 Tax=Eutrema salsugineum TaxID=72664 RepID=UPI000CED540C|nr:uncharacterized protein LOC112082115 [Eutrema salsugineum]